MRDALPTPVVDYGSQSLVCCARRTECAEPCTRFSSSCQCTLNGNVSFFLGGGTGKSGNRAYYVRQPLLRAV